MPLVIVDFPKRKIQNLSDRAYRYRAVKAMPEGSKRCVFCGASQKLMAGHLDGHEENTAPDNLVWTCRTCNSLHGNALKRAEWGVGPSVQSYALGRGLQPR